MKFTFLDTVVENVWRNFYNSIKFSSISFWYKNESPAIPLVLLEIMRKVIFNHIDWVSKTKIKSAQNAHSLKGIVISTIFIILILFSCFWYVSLWIAIREGERKWGHSFVCTLKFWTNGEYSANLNKMFFLTIHKMLRNRWIKTKYEKQNEEKSDANWAQAAVATKKWASN